VDIVKEDDGYTLQVQLEVPNNVTPMNPGQIVPPGGAIAPAVIRPPVGVGRARVLYTGGYQGLVVLDEKGQRLPMDITMAGAARAGTQSGEYTFKIVPQEGQGEPAKLTFTGFHVVSVDIPFTLKDVTLP
jgi:hypothetical protein